MLLTASHTACNILFSFIVSKYLLLHAGNSVPLLPTPATSVFRLADSSNKPTPVTQQKNLCFCSRAYFPAPAPELAIHDRRLLVSATAF